jgi:dephospho-CoA kinase
VIVVGLTGGIGSGKTAVSDRFSDLGISVVDADIAARTVVSKGRPALKAIAERFGQQVLLSDDDPLAGELDRAALRNIIFNDPAERKWLEQLTHPLIREEILQGIQSTQSAYCILASPLLIESGQALLCQRILVVDVPESLQLSRTMSRDNNSEAQVKAIIAAQASRTQRLDHADDVICNDQSLSTLNLQVNKLHQQYLALAS